MSGNDSIPVKDVKIAQLEAVKPAPDAHPFATMNAETFQAAIACANAGLPDAQRAVDSKIGSCQIVHDGNSSSLSILKDASGAPMQITESNGDGSQQQLTRGPDGKRWTMGIKNNDGKLQSEISVSDVQISPDGKSLSFTTANGDKVSSNEHGNQIVTKEGRIIVQGAVGTTEYPSPKEMADGFSPTTKFADGRIQVLPNGKGGPELQLNPDGTGRITFNDGFEKEINPPYSKEAMKMFNDMTIAKLTERPGHQLKVEVKRLDHAPAGH